MPRQVFLLDQKSLTPVEKFFYIYAKSGKDRFECGIPFEKVLEVLALESPVSAIASLKRHYIPEADYVRRRDTTVPGRPRDYYYLNEHCFQSFCLTSKAQRGHLVRSSYLTWKSEFDQIERPAVMLSMLHKVRAIEAGLLPLDSLRDYLEVTMLQEKALNDNLEALKQGAPA